MTNKIFRACKILVLSSMAVSNTFSQEALELREYFPPSPTAKEFIKYGEYPVGMYTGVPNISIPLYTINSKDIEIPISINYHSAGIQVDQIASEVGLGWSLNAGGMISKVPRGLPDDAQDGYLKYNVPEVSEIGLDYDFLDDVVLGERDTESDLYHYNFGGYSGTFFFDREGEERLVEEVPISIDYFEGVPSKFVVTTETGIVYEFNETEQTTTQSLGQSQVVNHEQNYTSTWHLSKIISTNKTDTISFSYDPVTPIYTYQYNYRETTAVGNYPDNTYPSDHEFGHLSSITQTINTPKRVKEIIFPNGKIVFNRATGRLDAGWERLDNIEVYSFNGVAYEPIKSFEFIQDHYYSSMNILHPINPDSTHASRYRLKLIELHEYDKTSVEAKKHLFDYNQDMLPPVGSNGKDFWGYYNGKISNTTLIPKQDIVINGNDVGSADRDPHATNMQAGILEKITYPTGGYTQFTFEPNEYFTTEGQVVDTTVVANAVGLDNIMIGDLPYLQHSVPFTPNYSGYATLKIEASDMISQQGTIPTVILEQLGANGYTILSRIIDPYQYPPDSNSKIEVTFDPILVHAGTSYELKVMVEGSSTSTEFDGAAYIIADITYKKRNTATPTTKITGGLRVQKIESYTRPGEMAFSKRYEYSSGKLITPEHFLNEQYLVQEVLYMIGGGAGGGVNCPSQGGFQRRFLTGGTVQDLTLSGGSPVVYSGVNEYIEDRLGNNIGKTHYTFDIQVDEILPVSLAYRGGIMLIKKDWMGGQNKSTTTYSNGGTDFITYEENDHVHKKYNEAQSYKMYKVLPFAKLEGPSTSCWRDLPNSISNYRIVEYPIHSGIKLVSSKISTIKDVNGNEVTTTTSIFYDNDTHLQPTRTETVRSDGKTLLTKTYYPDDVTAVNSLGNIDLTANQFQAIEQLKMTKLNTESGEHRIAEPIQTETIIDGDTTIQRTNYRTWSGHNLTLPEFVETSKNGTDLEQRLNYRRYGTHGNPLELSKTNGAIVSYFWGHNGEYPIAKIENASYTEIAAALGVLENELEGYDQSNLAQLNGLRTNPDLSQAMVTTYTYEPLIGVTSITDPRGYITHYEYDEFNRLKEVRDEDNYLMTDHEYHYKN